jgi:hypothetical protein
MNPTIPNQQLPQPTLPQGGTSRTPSTPTMQQFAPHHNQIYEMLRSTLMQLHQQGVPGIDQVLNSLNQQHVKQMKGMPQPTMNPAQLSGQSAQMTSYLPMGDGRAMINGQQMILPTNSTAIGANNTGQPIPFNRR